jgi:Protein of unknown function (DUF2877)
MRCLAAASRVLRPVLAGPPRPAQCLGVARGALYLRIAEPPGVLALLCQDAVRLPCGLVLPVTSAELPLTSLAPADPAPAQAAVKAAGFVVGDHAVRWTGPAGPVVVRAVREWAPARTAAGRVTASALAAVRSELGLGASPPTEGERDHLDRWKFTVARATANYLSWHEFIGADPGIDARLLAGLPAAAGDREASVAAAARLLGRGAGLTPTGDDLLAGFLVGATAFGIDAAALRHAIAVLAPARTTALSAALLWHAARGECIDELAAVGVVLTSQRLLRPEQAGRAVGRLMSVGHTSGAAMALGLVTAAEGALPGQEGRAA